MTPHSWLSRDTQKKEEKNKAYQEGQQRGPDAHTAQAGTYAFAVRVAKQPVAPGRVAAQAAVTLSVSAQPVLAASLQLGGGDPTNFPPSMPLSLSCSVPGACLLAC